MVVQQGKEGGEIMVLLLLLVQQQWRRRAAAEQGEGSSSRKEEKQQLLHLSRHVASEGQARAMTVARGVLMASARIRRLLLLPPLVPAEALVLVLVLLLAPLLLA